MTIHHTAKITEDEGVFIPIRKLSEPLNSHEKHIVASPYSDEEHFLELNRLDVGHRALALALQSFEAHDQQTFAFTPYEESFNIPAIVERTRLYAQALGGENLDEVKAYVIAFRSILHFEVQESTEKRKRLAVIDKDSHREAVESGGLLKYWYGTPDDVHAKNLATCWWTNRADAKAGGGGKAHRSGMAMVKGWYKHWHVEEFQLLITRDTYTFAPAHERK